MGYLELLHRTSPAFLYFKGHVHLAHAYQTLQRASMSSSVEDTKILNDQATELYNEAILALVEAAPTALKDNDAIEALLYAGAISDQPPTSSVLQASHWLQVCSYYVNDACGTIE